MSGVLVVCTGNVCRSPMAEGFLRAALVARVDGAAPLVRSAGTAGWEGSGATHEAIEAARERGVDIAAHRARELSHSLVAQADLVVCMAAEHRRATVRMDPDARDRTFTLSELVRVLEAARPSGSVAERVAVAAEARDRTPGLDPDVRDPLGDPLDGYREIAAQLQDLTGRLAAALVDGDR
jgi:protein-tyrosine phosphatase